MTKNYIFILLMNFYDLISIKNILCNIIKYLDMNSLNKLIKLYPKMINKLNLDIIVDKNNYFILEHANNIKKIDLYNKFNKKINLIEIFKKNRYIEKIVLPIYTIDRDIIKLSSYNNNLTEIDLSKTKLNDEDIKYIFFTNFKINKIYFPKGIKDISLYHLGQYNHNIEVISLCKTNITDIGIYHLCKYNNNIKYLDLSFCKKITDKITDYLKNNELISLNIKFSKISDDAIIKIINPKMKYLMISNVSLDKIFKYLEDNEIQLELLYIFVLRNYAFSDKYDSFFKKINQIKYLYIYDIRITNNNIKTLIENNKNLIYLYVYSNYIDYTLLDNISNSQKNIEYLYLNTVQYVNKRCLTTIDQNRLHFYNKIHANKLFRIYSESYSHFT